MVRFLLCLAAMSNSNDCLALDYMDSVIGELLPLPVARELVVHEFEKRYLRAMLTRHRSVADAARQSGIALRYFQLLRKRRAP